MGDQRQRMHLITHGESEPGLWLEDDREESHASRQNGSDDAGALVHEWRGTLFQLLLFLKQLQLLSLVYGVSMVIPGGHCFLSIVKNAVSSTVCSNTKPVVR